MGKGGMNSTVRCTIPRPFQPSHQLHSSFSLFPASITRLWVCSVLLEFAPPRPSPPEGYSSIIFRVVLCVHFGSVVPSPLPLDGPAEVRRILRASISRRGKENSVTVAIIDIQGCWTSVKGFLSLISIDHGRRMWKRRECLTFCMIVNGKNRFIGWEVEWNFGRKKWRSSFIIINSRIEWFCHLPYLKAMEFVLTPDDLGILNGGENSVTLEVECLNGIH